MTERSEVILFPTKKFLVSEGLNFRRLDYALSILANLPRKEARELIEKGFVLVNDCQITFPSKKVSYKDQIVLVDYSSYLSKFTKIEIIYEDEHLIVVNKPPYILTNKESSETGESLEEILLKQRKTVYPVHRLDKETTGVVIFAKTEKAQKYLINEFKRYRIKKTYLGIVNGILRNKVQRIKGMIRKGYEYADTFYKVIEVLNKSTLVRFIPITGRTHQIRIQMAKLGHPIIGDKKYGGAKNNLIYFPRHALHSEEISFIHLETGKRVKYSAPIPDDMKALIKFLKG